MPPVIQTTTTHTESSSTSYSLNVPSGVTDGDLLIAIVAVFTGRAITPPSGWTEVETEVQDDSPTGGVWHRTASSEPASYSWSVDNARTWLGCMLRIDSDNGYDVSDSLTESADNPDSPSITPTNADSLAIYSMVSNGEATTVTQPTGTTNAFTPVHINVANDHILGVAYETHGATATGTQEWDGNSEIYGGWMASIAVAPAAGGGLIPTIRRFLASMG